MSARRLLVLLCVAAAAWTTAWAVPATARSRRLELRCGTVVDDRLTLDRDLRCTGPALIIRNPRTVVQLNGHVLESARPCHDAGSGVGIVVEPTAGRAQILGPGIVRGFQHGMTIDATAQVQLRDLRITDSCGVGLLVRGTNATRGRSLVFDHNGDGGEIAGAVRVDHAQRFALADSELFSNDPGAAGAVIDLRACEGCRIAGNRVLANRGAGIRLDVDSHGNEIERNLIVGQRPNDVVDQGADNVFVLNGFERGDGVDPPVLWPLLGIPASPAPGVAGCGTLHTRINPKQTVTLICPQDPGLRAVRNSVVSYRLMNVYDTLQLFGGMCDPVTIEPADATEGGVVTCTNPNPLYPAILEITCCLN